MKNVSPLTKKDIKFSKKGMLPILSDGETIIEDSTDIVLYLEEKYPTPALLPKDGPARQEALKWEDWADEQMPTIHQYISYTRPTNAKHLLKSEALATEGDTWEKFLLGTAGPYLFPLMLLQKKKVSSLHDLKDEVHRALNHLESSLEGKNYLLGKTISLPDVAIHGFVDTFRGLKGDSLYFNNPNIKAWDERVGKAIQAKKKAVAKGA